MKSAFFTIFLKLKPELFYLLITVYFFFCFFYAFERMLNTDCSLQLFQIINSKNFFFQENRFGVWLTQFPLLIAVYIQIPIKFLIYIYSISFPLEYLLIIWINHKVFKSKEAALATILSLIFGVAFSFFHSTTETHQLLAFSCLLFGLLQSKERFSKSYFFYTLLILLLLWCLFTHPNAVFTIFFVVGLTYLQKKINRFDIILSISFIILFIIIKTLLSQKGNYDSRQYDQLLNYKETLPNFLSLYPFRFLYTKILTTYLAGFSIIVIVWLGYKKYSELIFCTLCFLGFTGLTILTFSNGDSDAMMEKSFMPGFFMFILIYSIFYYQAKNKIIYPIITSLLCFSSFINIVHASELYTQRLNLLSKIIKSMDKNTPKIIANFSDFDIPNNWATSMDVLMLSKSKSDTVKTVFLTENRYTNPTDTTNPTLFLYLPWGPYGVKKLNTVYFSLPEVPYKIYKNSQKIYLKAMNGKFVCNDISLKNIIIANRDNAFDWETFYLINLGKDKIAIRSFDHHHLCAELGKKSEITATREHIGNWETFSLIKLDSNFVAFKAFNEKYLSLDEKTNQLFATANSVGNHEKFKLMIVK